jgi:hypothetical protein
MIMEKENNILQAFEKIKDNPGFVTPPGYFDTFVSRLKDRITIENSVKVKEAHTHRRVLALAYYAGGVALIIAIVMVSIYRGITPVNINNISDETIAAYLDQNITDIDESMLAAEMPAISETGPSTVEEYAVYDAILNNEIIDNDIVNNNTSSHE